MRHPTTRPARDRRPIHAVVLVALLLAGMAACDSSTRPAGGTLHDGPPPLPHATDASAPPSRLLTSATPALLGAPLVGPDARRSLGSPPTLPITTASPAALQSVPIGPSPSILWEDLATGARGYFAMSGSTLGAWTPIGTVSTELRAVGYADFTGDNLPDMLFENSRDGSRWVLQLNATDVPIAWRPVNTVPTEWHIAGVATLTNGATADILWQNTLTGEIGLYRMNGASVLGWTGIGRVDADLRMVAVGDFTGDGKPDLVFENLRDGTRWVLQMNGATAIAWWAIGAVPTELRIRGAGDFTTDGQLDLLFENTRDGSRWILRMTGTAAQAWIALTTLATSWHITGAKSAPSVALAIVAVSPDTLRFGETATLTLSTASTSAASVTVDGVAATVRSIGTQSITIDVPASFGCAVPRSATISVSIGGSNTTRSWPLIPSPTVTLALNDVRPLAAGTSCVVIGPTTGDFFLLAYDLNPTPNALTALRFDGSVTGQTVLAASSPGATELPALPSSMILARSRARELAVMMSREAARHSIDSVALKESAIRAATVDRQRVQRTSTPTLPTGIDTIVGNTSLVRWRSGADCNGYATITGRTVFESAHAILIEDSTSPLAGQIDDYWRWLGTEFESRMFGLQQQYFGNLFARDIAGLGKVLIVATRRTNDGGAAGFADVCAFQPRTINGASNEMPTLSLSVPFTVADVAWWETYTAGTLMHETFHEVHLSERLSRTMGANAYETTMMGEGTANYAAEVYLRVRCGWAPRANIGFTAILQCEQREQVAGHPLTVFANFYGDIATYIAGIETHSPIADGYSSSALFLRSAIDNSGLDEATTIKSYVTDVSLTGVANFATHVGRSYDLLVGEHAVAVTTDGLSGFAPVGRYQIPSWNLRDIFLGMKNLGWFTTAYPLQLHAMVPGAVSSVVPSLAAGTTSVIEFHPATIGSVALKFTAPNGLALDPNIRITAVRVK